MTWIIQHKSQVRIGAFALLLIAILGPWGYEYDGVLLAENSSKPVLLIRVCVGAGQVQNGSYHFEGLSWGAGLRSTGVLLIARPQIDMHPRCPNG